MLARLIDAKFISYILEWKKIPFENSWNSSSRTSVCKFCMNLENSSKLISKLPSLPKRCSNKVVSKSFRLCNPSSTIFDSDRFGVDGCDSTSEFSCSSFESVFGNINPRRPWYAWLKIRSNWSNKKLRKLFNKGLQLAGQHPSYHFKMEQLTWL